MLLREVRPDPAARGSFTKPRDRLLLSSSPQGCTILKGETPTSCLAAPMSRTVGSLFHHLPCGSLQATILLNEFSLPAMVPILIASSNSFLTSFQSLETMLLFSGCLSGTLCL